MKIGKLIYMAIQLKPNQSCTLEFTHKVTKEPSKLHIACNPLTGDWLQIHTIGKKEASYYGTKTAALSLANAIVKDSKKLNLPCTVTIKDTP